MTPHRLLATVTLAAEIVRLPPDGRSNRRSVTLVKTSGLRVVLVTTRAGGALHEHVAPGTITMQPLRGRFVVAVEGKEREIASGMLVALDGQTRRAERALEDGAFLLTIAWPGEDRSTGTAESAAAGAGEA